MLQLKCTQKVLRELGLTPSSGGGAREPGTRLGHWYVNLFTVDRRRTFLFMNERTLLSFMIFGIKKSNVQHMPEAFVRGLVQLLMLEEFKPAEIERALAGYETLEIARTDSRKLLGNMNDLMDLYRHHILWEGGFASCDLNGIFKRMNRTPQRNLGWAFSIDVVRELLANDGGRAS